MTYVVNNVIMALKQTLHHFVTAGDGVFTLVAGGLTLHHWEPVAWVWPHLSSPLRCYYCYH